MDLDLVQLTRRISYNGHALLDRYRCIQLEGTDVCAHCVTRLTISDASGSVGLAHLPEFWGPGVEVGINLGVADAMAGVALIRFGSKGPSASRESLRSTSLLTSRLRRHRVRWRPRPGNL